ncbi:MAG: winged helix-turn-helix transcriptional regulator, partial [Pararhodobacter sp.]|nr:winged helix-turn-helix transcriptional regulator [Pararhodobacter sp.]
SRELKVAASNTTGVVNALLREGLVEQCTVAGDRRASLVRLTPRGRAEFTRQSASLRKWIGTLLAPLEAQEAAMVSVAHDRVIAALLEGNGQNNDPSGHR